MALKIEKDGSDQQWGEYPLLYSDGKDYVLVTRDHTIWLTSSSRGLKHTGMLPPGFTQLRPGAVLKLTVT